MKPDKTVFRPAYPPADRFPAYPPADHFPKSAATTSLPVLISGSVVILIGLVVLCLVIYRRRRQLSRCCCCSSCRGGGGGRCCSSSCKCCTRTLPEDVREYLTMEDLLLEVEDGTPARLASAPREDDAAAAEEVVAWTAEALVPNILKARVKKRSNSQVDLTTPLL